MSARSFKLFGKEEKTQSNIVVTYKNGIRRVYLHGSPVVKIDQDNNIYLNSYGYKTATTKVAINNALNQLGVSFRVSQKKGIWFLKDNNQNEILFFDEMKLPMTPVEKSLLLNTNLN